MSKLKGYSCNLEQYYVSASSQIVRWINFILTFECTDVFPLLYKLDEVAQLVTNPTHANDAILFVLDLE